jgi:hypothetical protein
MGIVTLLASIVAVGLALAPFVVAIVEVVKALGKVVAKPDGVPGELLPTVAVLVGMLLALAVLGFKPDSDYRVIAIGGAVGGLMASGLFDRGQARVATR